MAAGLFAAAAAVSVTDLAGGWRLGALWGADVLGGYLWAGRIGGLTCCCQQFRRRCAQHQLAFSGVPAHAVLTASRELARCLVVGAGHGDCSCRFPAASGGLPGHLCRVWAHRRALMPRSSTTFPMIQPEKATARAPHRVHAVRCCCRSGQVSEALMLVLFFRTRASFSY